MQSVVARSRAGARPWKEELPFAGYLIGSFQLPASSFQFRRSRPFGRIIHWRLVTENREPLLSSLKIVWDDSRTGARIGRSLKRETPGKTNRMLILPSQHSPGF